MSRVLIIAEAGVNHNGSLELAKELVDKAVEAGADYVKFQTFRADKLATKTAAKANYQVANTDSVETQFEMLKRLELTEKMHEVLIDYCAKRGIQFLSTPFDIESIDLLKSFGITLGKIPSGEITNLPYLKHMARSFQKIILSTGMSDLEEIRRAIAVLVSNGIDKSRITVLHCNTEYPTPFSDVNLRAMQMISTDLGVSVGYSDHTNGIEVPVAAVALGAVIIEKHFTTDKALPGPDHKASLEPNELKQMVSSIRNIEAAMGDGVKRPSQSEKKNILIARKSIHIRTDVQPGTVLREEHLIMKRPGNGISPMDIELIIGRKVRQSLRADHQLRNEDLV
jgi:N,N'-diacetyllegionaminate synthase